MPYEPYKRVKSSVPWLEYVFMVPTYPYDKVIDIGNLISSKEKELSSKIGLGIVMEGWTKGIQISVEDPPSFLVKDFKVIPQGRGGQDLYIIEIKGEDLEVQISKEPNIILSPKNRRVFYVNPRVAFEELSKMKFIIGDVIKPEIVSKALQEQFEGVVKRIMTLPGINVKKSNITSIDMDYIPLLEVAKKSYSVPRGNKEEPYSYSYRLPTHKEDQEMIKEKLEKLLSNRGVLENLVKELDRRHQSIRSVNLSIFLKDFRERMGDIGVLRIEVEARHSVFKGEDANRGRVLVIVVPALIVNKRNERDGTHEVYQLVLVSVPVALFGGALEDITGISYTISREWVDNLESSWKKEGPDKEYTENLFSHFLRLGRKNAVIPDTVVLTFKRKEEAYNELLVKDLVDKGETEHGISVEMRWPREQGSSPTLSYFYLEKSSNDYREKKKNLKENHFYKVYKNLIESLKRSENKRTMEVREELLSTKLLKTSICVPTEYGKKIYLDDQKSISPNIAISKLLKDTITSSSTKKYSLINTSHSLLLLLLADAIRLDSEALSRLGNVGGFVIDFSKRRNRNRSQFRAKASIPIAESENKLLVCESSLIYFEEV